MFNRINKKERIEQWINFCDIDIDIVIPSWGQSIPRGQFIPKENRIVINGKQSEKEIIKSIIHEICHWKNNDQVDDPDIWEREERCQQVEKQWKVEPENVKWR